MALTSKKIAFAHAKMDGADNRQAAIFAGYSVESASVTGSKLAKDADILAYIESKKSEHALVSKVKAISSDAKAQVDPKADPLDYLVEVFSNEAEDPKLRLDAAKAALPYFHGKIAEKGKKETKADEAKVATLAGKYASLSSQLRS